MYVPFSIPDREPSVWKPVYLLFYQLQTVLSYPDYFLFALFSAAIRYLPFAPMSLQQVLAISRHIVSFLFSVVRQPENGVYLAHLVNPQSLERIHQSRIIVRHCIESVSQYGERSRILHPFFPLEGAEGVILYFPFLYFSLLYFTLLCSKLHAFFALTATSCTTFPRLTATFPVPTATFPSLSEIGRASCRERVCQYV